MKEISLRPHQIITMIEIRKPVRGQLLCVCSGEPRFTADDKWWQNWQREEEGKRSEERRKIWFRRCQIEVNGFSPIHSPPSPAERTSWILASIIQWFHVERFRSGVARRRLGRIHRHPETPLRRGQCSIHLGWILCWSPRRRLPSPGLVVWPSTSFGRPMTEDKRFSTYPKRDSKPVADNGSVPVVKRRRMIPLAGKLLAADSRSH